MASVNPFRYRGYYYDNETGFYYLQTRYYDPTICRFINANNYEIVAELSNVDSQLNIYAYCNNKVLTAKAVKLNKNYSKEYTESMNRFVK